MYRTTMEGDATAGRDDVHCMEIHVLIQCLAWIKPVTLLRADLVNVHID